MSGGLSLNRVIMICCQDSEHLGHGHSGTRVSRAKKESLVHGQYLEALWAISEL